MKLFIRTESGSEIEFDTDHVVGLDVTFGEERFEITIVKK